MRISVSKASCNALAAWLQQNFASDVTTYAHWPQGPELKGRVVSVIPVGNRVRDDSYGQLEVSSRVNVSPTKAKVRFRQGDLTQPLQLDVWTDSDDGRDDILAQLDDFLHAGLAASLNTKNSLQTVTSDPINDELSLPLVGDYVGDFATYQFDEYSIDDTPDSIQRCEYRATLLGQARMPYTFFRTVPRLIAATFELTNDADGVEASTTLNAGPPPFITHT